MTSDLPGDPASEPLGNPDEDELPPDTAPEPDATPPGSAAEEEIILDSGQSQAPAEPV
jgi:hypothetical protein